MNSKEPVKKEIKFGRVRVRISKIGKDYLIFINTGRYIKGKEVDTNTVYPFAEWNPTNDDEVWVDLQDKKLTGVEVHLYE